MEIAVALAQSRRNTEQIGKLFLVKDGGFRPIAEDASVSQKNHALNLRNNLGYMVRHKQNSHPGLRKLAHRVPKLELCADIQSVAGLIKKQRLRLMHQRSRNQRPLGFAGRHLRNSATSKMRNAKPF